MRADLEGLERRLANILHQFSRCTVAGISFKSGCTLVVPSLLFHPRCPYNLHLIYDPLLAGSPARSGSSFYSNALRPDSASAPFRPSQANPGQYRSQKGQQCFTKPRTTAPFCPFGDTYAHYRTKAASLEPIGFGYLHRLKPEY